MMAPKLLNQRAKKPSANITKEQSLKEVPLEALNDLRSLVDMSFNILTMTHV